MEIEKNKVYNYGKRKLLYLGDITPKEGENSETYSRFINHNLGDFSDIMEELYLIKNEITEKENREIKIPEKSVMIMEISQNMQPRKYKETKEKYYNVLEKSLEAQN
jgi:hypothetical protein